MSGIGSFDPEALNKLKKDYAEAMKTAEELEHKGYFVRTGKLGVETSPVPSVWSNASLWSYPSGEKESPTYDNELENVDHLISDAELQEIIEDLNTPVEDELEEFAEIGLEDFDLESLSVEEMRALAKTILGGDFQEEDGYEEKDLDDLTPEEFDDLIESILEDMGDDEDEDDEDEEELDLNEIATLMLKELKDYDIDVLSLSEDDLYSLVESVLYDEDEEEDEEESPINEKLDAIEQMIQQIKEEM